MALKKTSTYLFYKKIIETIDDAMILFDAGSTVLFVNPAFSNTFSVHADTVIGQNYHAIFGSKLHENHDPIQDALTSKEDRAVHGVFIKLKDVQNEFGPFCINATHFQAGQERLCLVVFKDMSQIAEYIEGIKEAGHLMEQERNNFSHILDGIADGYYTTNLNRRIIRINDKLLKMIGKTSDEVLGKECKDFFSISDCHKNCPISLMQVENKPVLNIKSSIKGKDGSIIPIRKNTFPIRDLQNRMSGSMCIIYNRTEVELLRNKLEVHGLNLPLVSNSKQMSELFELILSMNDTDPFILLTGESGTGKEIIASAIVENSRRNNKPYLKINCSALPEGLLESELFGHKKGAFTGATADKIGKFSFANSGTILLDEIGDMPLPLQAKVLRVLENGEFQPVGAVKTEKTDVRVISATNQDLQKQMSKGLFREDLYYRLCVVPIEIPPLRQRKEDIPLLIQQFISAFSKRYGKKISDVSARAFVMLTEYNWPGNIRELRNAIEHAFACVNGEIIERQHLPLHIRRSVDPVILDAGASEDTQEFIQIDREKLVRFLRKFHGNRALTAKALRISRTTLWRKIKALDIREYQ